MLTMLTLIVTLASNGQITFSAVSTGPRPEKCKIFLAELDELARKIETQEESYHLTAGTTWGRAGKAVYAVELSGAEKTYHWQVEVEVSPPEEAAKDMAEKVRLVLATHQEAGRD